MPNPIHPQNRVHLRRVVESLFASQPEMSPGDRDDLLHNLIAGMFNGSTAETSHWMLDLVDQLTQQEIAYSNAAINLMGIVMVFSENPTNFGALQEKFLNIAERLLDRIEHGSVLESIVREINNHLQAINVMNILDPALVPRMDAIAARVRGLAA